jgi:hypothetical protein
MLYCFHEIDFSIIVRYKIKNKNVTTFFPENAGSKKALCKFDDFPDCFYKQAQPVSDVTEMFFYKLK